MTVNYLIKCPICGKVTRMRSPAGYIYSTPVRVHCGNCNTIMCGEFISDEKTHRAYFKSENCIDVTFEKEKYDYYGETSGELLCRKIISQEEHDINKMMPFFSPVFDFFDSTDDKNKDAFINYACFATELSECFDNKRVKYDLYLNGKYDLLCENFEDDAKMIGYNLRENIYQFIFYSIFFEWGGIFKQHDITKKLININYHFYHLDKSALNEYIEYLRNENRVDFYQNKIFNTFFSYQKITSFLIPAIGATYYDDISKIDKTMMGLSTCTFEDIKHFYQDAFEDLAECCDLVAGLDNIESRNNYNKFNDKNDMKKFREQKKGNRIKLLSQSEFFAKTFNMSNESNNLRNAIGHNNYKYDGMKQELAYQINSLSNEIERCYLLDVAIECVELIKSAYILLFYIYEIKRYMDMAEGMHSQLHPMFYKSTSSQAHCPCGSGKKYNKCCKDIVKDQKRVKVNYPNRSSLIQNTSNFMSAPFLNKKIRCNRNLYLDFVPLL